MIFENLDSTVGTVDLSPKRQMTTLIVESSGGCDYCIAANVDQYAFREYRGIKLCWYHYESLITFEQHAWYGKKPKALPKPKAGICLGDQCLVLTDNRSGYCDIHRRTEKK